MKVKMTSPPDQRTITAASATLLFSIFFLIAAGLGYPILNRFDPRQTPGLSDVKAYAAIVTGASGFEAQGFEPQDMRYRRFRVLVPWIARPFYHAARGRLGTWDPVMFGLLISDSLFIAGTALLIVILGRRRVGSSAAGLVAALLFLVNFAVPNLRLVGLVDAGEGFFLLALFCSLLESQLWAVPVIAVLGALTKESFVPLSMTLAIAWWCARRLDRRFDLEDSDREGRDQAGNRGVIIIIIMSGLLGLAAIVALHRSITGAFVSPMQIARALPRGGGYHFILPLHDRNLWYTFAWLLPTAIPNLKRFPKSWIVMVASTCAVAFVLDAGFGGGPEAGSAWGRELFSIAGPILSLSSALFLLQI